MSKKRDPVIAVLKYFQEAELPLAQQALSLVQQTLRARVPTVRVRHGAKPKPTEPVGSLGSTQGA
jgi:hypothetical protein